MFDIKLMAAAASLLLGFGALSVAGAGGTDPVASLIDSASDVIIVADEPFHCEVRTSYQNGMTTLEGMVESDEALSGRYQFRVVSAGRSGNSNIQQGGPFSVDADETVTLGRVSLGGSSADYDASLTVTLDGVTTACTEIGGFL